MVAEQEYKYRGTIKQLSKKDPANYLITCDEAREWYGCDARLPVDLMPEEAEVGDTITFSLTETADGTPVTKWVEKYKAKEKRKAVAMADENMYIGIVKKKSVKDPSCFLIECDEAKEGYSFPVKMSEEEKPANVEVGDTITFSVGEKGKSDNPQPWAIHVENADDPTGGSNKRKKVKAKLDGEGEGEVKFWSEEAALAAVEAMHATWVENLQIGCFASEHSDRTVVVTGLPVDMSSFMLKRAFSMCEPTMAFRTDINDMQGSARGEVRMGTPESAVAALALDGGIIEASKVGVKLDESECDTLHITGLGDRCKQFALRDAFGQFGDVTRAKVIEVDEYGNEKGKGNDKGGGKGKGKTGQGHVVGDIRFEDWDGAEAALALNDSILWGSTLRVEVDAKAANGEKVKIFGLPFGCTTQALRKHFEQTDHPIVFCQIQERKGKGKGNAKAAW